MSDAQNGECDMLKALYDFEATLAKTLSFTEGEFFYLQQTNTKQRNWWHVVNRKGHVGFVPSNYVASVKADPEFFLAFLNDCIKNLNENHTMSSQKQETLARLKEKKKQIQLLVKPASKKPPAPKPPPRWDDSTSPNGVSPSFDLRPVVSQQHVSEEYDAPQSPIKTIDKPLQEVEEDRKKNNVPKTSNQLSSDTDNQDDSQDSSESIKPNAIYEIVQAVRKETQLSHEMSKVAVETVLISLREFLPGGAARSIIDALLREANSNITCPKNAIDAAPDALRMMTALNALSKAANDAQQRGWALHDDAHDIQTQLLELISVMSNADINISQHVLSSHRYAYVTTLVQFYQMETRWPLRQLLLQYGYKKLIMNNVVGQTKLRETISHKYILYIILDNSESFNTAQYPKGLDKHTYIIRKPHYTPDLAWRDRCDRDRRDGRLERALYALLGARESAESVRRDEERYDDRYRLFDGQCVIEQLGVEFAQFLLELIENPPETDVDEQIPDLFLTLLLAYNLQFDNPHENLLLDALETQDNAKTFCEKVLLLLNREEDPVHIFDHEPAPPHSVLKLVIDLFSRKKTAEHFYTNDVKVAIDIIVRQLADLSPGDNRRWEYLRVVQGIVRNTDYGAHRHRRDDLLRCFARILCEDAPAAHVAAAARRDHAAVRAIYNEFPHFFLP
ncbi:NCK-interacting protein with SH3 domain [Papilio machaon]|uniref:NCK-interacting protein with SH3 domain n=1 Tax=Papilio machaon TaxID=76193 RepID=A0A194QRK7_PAPMA|nr:NCK-interacting protein with SH3 domain [Papilio machaon]